MSNKAIQINDAPTYWILMYESTMGESIYSSQILYSG